MPSSPIRFSDEQSAVFKQVAEAIRSSQKAFAEAGRWLDGEANLGTYGDFEDEHAGKMKWVTKHERDDLKDRYARFSLIAGRLFDNFPNFESLPTAQRAEPARRILLALWLLTDPDAGNAERITGYQDWPWGTSGHDPEALDGVYSFVVTEGGEPGRCFARMGIVDSNIDGITDLAKLALHYAAFWPAKPMVKCDEWVNMDEDVVAAARRIWPDWNPFNPNWRLVENTLVSYGHPLKKVRGMVLSEVRDALNAVRVHSANGPFSTTTSSIQVFRSGGDGMVDIAVLGSAKDVALAGEGNTLSEFSQALQSLASRAPTGNRQILPAHRAKVDVLRVLAVAVYQNAPGEIKGIAERVAGTTARILRQRYITDIDAADLRGACDVLSKATVGERGGGAKADPPGMLPFTPDEQALFDVLTDAPQTGPDLVAKLKRQGYHNFDETKISRMSKRPHFQEKGVRNRQRAGYFIMQSNSNVTAM